MILKEIPLPKVWDKNLNYIGEIRPIKVSATIKLVPLSYASLQLPKGVNVPARGFVELFSSMGSLGIFRVRSPQDAYGDNITTAELEHAITEVGDYLVLGSYDEMMPANQAFTTIFSHYRGNHWQLGSVSALGTGQIAVQADHVRVLECLISLLEQKTDCMMSFDFSTTPWTLNFVKRGTVVSAEGRLARNVNYAKVSYDDTELCTRAYFQVSTTEEADPSGFPAFDANLYYSAGDFVAYGGKLYRLPTGHNAGVSWENTQKTVVNDVPSTTWQYVDSDTIGTYGIVEKEVYSGGEYTATEVLRVVQDFLNKHKEPKVSVEISAEELSNVTGEPFDAFEIGKLCRLALVDYGVTIERTITGLSWDNVYNSPLDITVNLEDEEDTAINFLHDIDTNGGTIGGSGGGGGGGGGKKKQEDVWKEYRTRFQQTDYYFDLQAARYNRADQILQQAGLYIDANGTLNYADDNERQIGGRLQVQADKVAMVVGTKNGKNYIKAAEISVSINKDGTGNANIHADHVYIGPISGADSDYTGKTLDGTVTAITSDFTTVNTLLAKKIEADDINATTVTAALSKATLVNVKQLSASSSIGCTGPISCTSLSVGGHGMNIYDGQVSSDGKTLTLFRLSGGSLSFSKAATLEATYGGSNQGTQATYTVTGSPAANFPSGATKTGTFTLHINALAAWVTDPNGTIRARVDNPADTDAAYNSGWNACRDAALDSGWTLSYYTGDVTTKYDAPSYGAQGRKVIYPYTSRSRTVYNIPDAK